MSSADIEALTRRRDDLAQDDHGAEAAIMAARAAFASAERQARAAGDLIATAAAQTRLDQARQQLDPLLAARKSRQAEIAALEDQITDLEKAADRREKNQAAGLSPAPWAHRPGIAGRTALYDRDGAFVGEMQHAADAIRLCELINEIVVTITPAD